MYLWLGVADSTLLNQHFWNDIVIYQDVLLFVEVLQNHHWKGVIACLLIVSIEICSISENSAKKNE